MITAFNHLIGSMPNPDKPPSLSAGCSMRSRLGWAPHWAQSGLRLFPCTKFTGLPLVPHWPKAAKGDDGQIVEWWSVFPDADIGAIPDSAGCFVLAAITLSWARLTCPALALPQAAPW